MVKGSADEDDGDDDDDDDDDGDEDDEDDDELLLVSCYIIQFTCCISLQFTNLSTSAYLGNQGSTADRMGNQ